MARRPEQWQKHIIIRADDSLHSKVQEVAETTGASKSSIVRTALGFMTAAQLTALISAQCGQQGQAAQHANVR